MARLVTVLLAALAVAVGGLGFAAAPESAARPTGGSAHIPQAVGAGLRAGPPSHRPGNGEGSSSDDLDRAGRAAYFLAQRAHAIGAAPRWSEHHSAHPGPGPLSPPSAVRLPGPGPGALCASLACDAAWPASQHGPRSGRAPPHRPSA